MGGGRLRIQVFELGHFVIENEIKNSILSECKKLTNTIPKQAKDSFSYRLIILGLYLLELPWKNSKLIATNQQVITYFSVI